MEKELDRLIDFIAKHHVFNDKSYPELKDADDAKKLLFALKHSSLHFAKISGKIATVSERIDHGETLDVDEIKKNIPKMLVSTLRLAELVGMTGDDLIKAIEDKYKDKII